MNTVQLSGKELSKQIFVAVRRDVSGLKARGIPVGLATILVGDDPASGLYVQKKIAACQELGIESFHYSFPGSVTQAQLKEKITELNNDERISGVLVQLPLPVGLITQDILDSLSPDKDVDCFHPSNLGRLFSCKTWPEIIGTRFPLPCTPHGIIRLLDYYQIFLEGKSAVVVGRSNIVGKPLALLLLARNSTVTICHSATPDLSGFTTRADILVVAVGKPGFITKDLVKEGAVVIDVGTNRRDGKVSGDVDSAVQGKAGALTPVPGGVGPLTIAMLMENTITLAKRQAGLISA